MATTPFVNPTLTPPANPSPSSTPGSYGNGPDLPLKPAAGEPGERDLLASVVKGAHETVDRVAQTVAPQVQRLQEGVSSAGEMLSSRAGQVRELSDEWAESLRSTVREKPIAAIATALAVGIVIARLTR